MIFIYLLTAVGQPPGGSSTAHISTHKQYTKRHKTNNKQNNTKILEECEPCPIFAGFNLTFALQLRKKEVKASVNILICEIISGSLYSSIDSCLPRILHMPFYFTEPNIFHGIFISHIAKKFPSLLYCTHDGQNFCITGILESAILRCVMIAPHYVALATIVSG